MSPRVLMLDPNSHTLPYDRALARALRHAGCTVDLYVSPFVYEPAAACGDPAIHRWFFRLASGTLGRFLRLSKHDRLRQLSKAAEYPIELAALASNVLRRPPSVVHVQWSLAPTLEVPMWRLWQRRGIRVVYTAHNLRPHATHLTNQTPEAPLYRAADVVIVHSSRTADALVAEFGVVASRVVVAPHGPLLEDEAELPPADARSRVGLPPDGPVILFAGLIEPYKGLSDLVTAFGLLASDLPTARLVVAGRPNVPVASEIGRLAAAGLSNRAHFDLRFLPQSDLAAYLCAADVVVLPYRATTTSGLLFAARRFGRPVVATRVGDLAEVIDHGRDGLLTPPADPPALAQAIRRMLADDTGRIRMGEAGRRVILQRDTWSNAAAQTLVAYGLATGHR